MVVMFAQLPPVPPAAASCQQVPAIQIHRLSSRIYESKMRAPPSHSLSLPSP